MKKQITLLVQQEELQAWSHVANQRFEGNLSMLIRSVMNAEAKKTENKPDLKDDPFAKFRK